MRSLILFKYNGPQIRSKRTCGPLFSLPVDRLYNPRVPHSIASCAIEWGYDAAGTIPTLSGWRGPHNPRGPRSVSPCCQTTLHRQNHPELRVATHHASECLGGLLERISFDHGPHTAQFGEVQRVLGICRCPRSPALNRPASGDEL